MLPDIRAEIASEIVDSLEAALAQFASIEEELDAEPELVAQAAE